MDIQNQIKTRGEEILKRMESQSKISLFSKDFWYGSIMDWSMKNESFKTQMFRFVDVLPSLNSGSDVAKHLKEYFSEGGESLPSVFNVGLGIGSLAPGLMAGAIKKNVTSMAKMFITGENPEEALAVLKKARKNQIAFTVDLLGEATLSEKEALEYQTKYRELIEWLSKDAKNWTPVPLIDSDELGALPAVNVSVKLTALYSQMNDRAWDQTKKMLKDRVRPLMQLAIKNNVFLNLDMEQYAVKDLTLEVFEELLMEDDLKKYLFFGCVIQAYLKDSLKDIARLIDFAKLRKTPFTVRLVKGAYWDFETIEAQQKGWEVPVFSNKNETDLNYEKASELLLKNDPLIKVAFASHNVRSIANALVQAEALKVPKQSFEIQMLYGMADPIKKSLVEMGYRVREYAPVGELLPGMAYLVRRLLENTSNESWLRGKFADNKSSEQLLRDPNSTAATPSKETKEKTPLFQNEPFKDFAISENRKAQSLALQKLEAQFPVSVKPCIQGQWSTSPQKLDRMNPSKKNQKVADIHLASRDLAQTAVQAAQGAFKKWKNTTPESRAQLLEKVAQLMKQKRFELNAIQIFEVGKTWTEADADVAEAIDFCNYYALEIRRILNPQKMGHAPGESSLLSYQPRGIALIIAPWNFPLAIITGMTVAALGTGNTVLIKPAEQSSLTAMKLMELLLEAGAPRDVVSFLPGLGEDIGEYLVDHPLVQTIAFTGSKKVGLEILKKSSNVKPGQVQTKRCVIEMGGKNAIIVDQDADLDEAVKGVLSSAFGFAGQKCSACSRVIVLKDVYEKFQDRLLEAVRSLHIAASSDPSSYYGPVVDEEAFLRILRTIEEGSVQAQRLFPDTPTENQDGYFIPPTLFSRVNPESALAQDEIFGPVLCLIEASDMAHALNIANSTAYALTGGLYSRSPANIKKVSEEFECGNLYINRGITGALVERHPFGGFKMSGLGSKAGGPDYLKLFMDPRCVTENMVRRGFAPLEEI